MCSRTFVNVRSLVIHISKIYFCYIWWKSTLKFTSLPICTVFCLLGFNTSFGSGGAKIPKTKVAFTIQYFLIKFADVPLSSNVTSGFISELHIDIVLWFKLLFHRFLASQFDHINRHMVVNVLVFVVFLRKCPMIYLSNSSCKRFSYCWREALTWEILLDIYLWACQ